MINKIKSYNNYHLTTTNEMTMLKTSIPDFFPLTK